MLKLLVLLNFFMVITIYASSPVPIEPNNFILEDLIIKNNNKELHTGLIKSFYANGVLSSEKNYKNGKLEGVSKVFNENGKLDSESYYKNGLPIFY